MADRIKITNLYKAFPQDGRQHVVLDNLTMTVEDRSFTTIVGPSGCGKSTLLNIMSNIEPATSGQIDIATEGDRPARVGYVFQSPRLLPWMSVLDNLLVVRPPSFDPLQFRQSAEHYLKMVGLGNDMTKFPLQLSGGMQQRVGIARALVIDPDVLLMDEPFSHLDELTAERMRQELLRIWGETRKTIIFVTHDLQEAIELGDRMLIFGKNGKMLDDIAITLPRPRDFSKPDVSAFYAECTQKFSALQHAVDQALMTAV